MNARFWLILASVALLWSCTQDGGLIYKTIESEKKVTDSTLPKTLTVHEVLKSAQAAPYFVASGAIYNGTVPILNADGTTTIGWPTVDVAAVAIDAPVAGALCNALAFDPGPGGELWGGFFMPDANLGLYRSTSRSFATGAADKITDPIVADKQITMLQFANGKLFVAAATVPVVGSAYVYELDYYNGATWSQLISGLAKPINGVAWDGANYLMVSGSTMYAGTNADPPGFDAGTSTLGTLTVSATDELRSVFAQPGKVIIASKLGLYVRDAGTWSQVAPAQVSGVTVPFLTATGPSDAGGSIYLAGTDGYGYYYLDWVAKTLTRFDTSTIGLYNAAVRRILVDGTTVFMGTSGAGLWRGTFESATGKLPAANAWVHE
jgi:hypothetical protein